MCMVLAMSIAVSIILFMEEDDKTHHEMRILIIPLKSSSNFQLSSVSNQFHE